MRRADIAERAGAVVRAVVRAAVAASVRYCTAALILHLEMVGEHISCADTTRSVTNGLKQRTVGARKRSRGSAEDGSWRRLNHPHWLLEQLAHFVVVVVWL